ncbi:hypothetical protein chiPu_0009050 [Chiloscyllium punctatum]|uniref:Uncharacterized protein n=1 Tax=Chiloscyllium punctatum TaxID=137246 RepID=A0A401SJJ6_CHIPU|nr:hypothetical protein [Chiloscyllium punctatum]
MQMQHVHVRNDLKSRHLNHKGSQKSKDMDEPTGKRRMKRIKMSLDDDYFLAYSDSSHKQRERERERKRATVRLQ